MGIAALGVAAHTQAAVAAAGTPAIAALLASIAGCCVVCGGLVEIDGPGEVTNEAGGVGTEVDRATAAGTEQAAGTVLAAGTKECLSISTCANGGGE